MRNTKLAAAFRTLGNIPPPEVEDSDDSRSAAMTKEEAALEVAKHFSRRIVNNAVSPYEGVKSIVWEACHPLTHCPSELKVFVALESDFADFSDDTRREYYGEQHCADYRSELADRIVEEAGRLINVKE